MKSLLFPFFTAIILTSCQADNPYKEQKKEIKIAFDHSPQTLDPRKSTDLYANNAINALYEGLMSFDEHEKIIPGVAKNVNISDDNKIYTFNLQNSLWSNGDEVTAFDFVETWKSLLKPEFPSPNANQFFVIKGAKNYKNGLVNFDEVGIYAKDKDTLIVELENPVPYFLKLAASTFYLPIHSSLREGQDLPSPITNGPFLLNSFKKNHELILKKNPKYRSHDLVHVETVIFQILDENTAYKMFELQELDRVGSPVATLPQDAIESLKRKNILQSKPGAGTHFFRFNVDSYPFNNEKLRKAFNAALNRKEIIENVTQGYQPIALGFVPPLNDWDTAQYYKDNDIPESFRLFQEALIELNLDKDHIPPITLSYTVNDRSHKIAQAVQQQWNKAFGIDVKLQAQEYKMFTENVLKGNYQIAAGSWYADFSDPISFLGIFDTKTNPANRTNWSDETYQKLIAASALEIDEEKRLFILKQAENLLMEDMPIAPLFFSSFNYLENERIGGLGLSNLGLINLKYTFFDNEETFNETLE